MISLADVQPFQATDETTGFDFPGVQLPVGQSRGARWAQFDPNGLPQRNSLRSEACAEEAILEHGPSDADPANGGWDAIRCLVRDAVHRRQPIRQQKTKSVTASPNPIASAGPSPSIAEPSPAMSSAPAAPAPLPVGSSLSQPPLHSSTPRYERDAAGEISVRRPSAASPAAVRKIHGPIRCAWAYATLISDCKSAHLVESTAVLHVEDWIASHGALDPLEEKMLLQILLTDARLTMLTERLTEATSPKQLEGVSRACDGAATSLRKLVMALDEHRRRRSPRAIG